MISNFIKRGEIMKKILVVIILLSFTSIAYAGVQDEINSCEAITASFDACALAPSKYNMTCEQAQNTVYRITIKKGFSERESERLADMCYNICVHSDIYWAHRNEGLNNCIAEAKAHGGKNGR